jgi:hypothetical protein
LTQRLGELRDAELVERVEDGRHVRWEPTAAGRALLPVIKDLGAWSQVWLRRPIRAEDLDPAVLMWDVRRCVVAEAFSPEPAVARFHFPQGPEGLRTFWLLRRDGPVELCLTNPGPEPGAVIHAELRAFTEVWIGRRSLREELRHGRVRVEGGPLANRFSEWIGLSPLAPSGGAPEGFGRPG